MMMERKTWMVVAALALLALLVTACGAGPAGVDDFGKNADGYADISVEELAAMLEEEDLTLVNVHIPYEGEIPQTDLFIPFDDIGAYVDQLPGRDVPIVLYCRSGSMSTSAAEELVGLGYSNVMELDGGFNAWEAAGYELLDEGR